MTVSLALRNQPGISEETRNRIQNLARERGYRPDPALSALISYRRNKSSHSHIGSVAFLNFYEEHPDPRFYINEMFEGASQKAQELGYKVYNFDGPTNKAEAARLKRILLSRGIRGIILSPIAEVQVPPVFDWQDFAVVCLGVSFSHRQFHTISGDTYYAGFLCAAQLRHSGCRRIGVCFTREQVDKVEQRYTGGASAFVGRLEDKTEFLPPFYFDTFSSRDFLTWFKKHRPDGLITGQGDLLKVFKKEGIKVPEDVSLVSPYNAGSITYVNQRFNEWGIWAMNTLGGLIKNNEVGMPDSPVEILIRGKLIHKGTTKSAAMSSKQKLSTASLPASLDTIA